MNILSKLQRRLDSVAIDQLREEVAALAEKAEELEAENQRLQILAADAQQWADQWRDDFMELQLSAYPDSSPGITQNGSLVVVRQ